MASPDSCLSEWNRPVVCGIGFLQALRVKGNDIRFGFVTSESTDAMRELAAASGALFLIAKPFTAETFSVLIIPHTLSVTTLGAAKAGDTMNLEIALMARSAARLRETRSTSPRRPHRPL